MARSIVIIGAHPDDETLTCGGTIVTALANGDRVTVVVMTAGDALDVSVAPPQRMDTGRERLAEVLRATQRLGLAADRLIRLGLPDRALPIMAAHMQDAAYVTDAGPQRFRSPVTGLDTVPYAEAYRPGLPLEGAAVERLLVDILAGAGATDVYTHHPLDDHPDHRALYWIVDQVLQGFGGRIHRHLFLTYQANYPGAWPPAGERYVRDQCHIPFGDLPSEELLLNSAQRQTKLTAIAEYAGTHGRIMGPDRFRWYADRFGKTNEVFWTL